jgi:hypothetical protein
MRHPDPLLKPLPSLRRRAGETIVDISRPERLLETVEMAAYPIPEELRDALETVPPSTEEVYT